MDTLSAIDSIHPSDTSRIVSGIRILMLQHLPVSPTRLKSESANRDCNERTPKLIIGHYPRVVEQAQAVENDKDYTQHRLHLKDSCDSKHVVESLHNS